MELPFHAKRADHSQAIQGIWRTSIFFLWDWSFGPWIEWSSRPIDLELVAREVRSIDPNLEIRS